MPFTMLWLALTLAGVAQTPVPKPIEELAAKLLAAQSEQERLALLGVQAELLTPQLSDQLNSQGKSLAAKSDYSAALVAHQLARLVAERIHYHKGAIVALSAMGVVQAGRGDFNAVLDMFQQALKLAETHGEKSFFAALQNGLCVAQGKLGNIGQAMSHCQQSVVLAEAEGNKAAAASAFNNLGNMASDRGNYEAALESYRKALALHEALGNKRAIGQVLLNLGMVNKGMGHLTAALQDYLRSLSIAEEVGSKGDIAQALNNVSKVYREWGNYRLALEYSQRGLALSEMIGDKSNLSRALAGIGQLHEQAGAFAQALEHYQKSLALAEATGNKMDIAARLGDVAAGYRITGNRQQAIEYYQRALVLAETINVPYTAIVFRNMLAQLYLEQGQADKALELAERAVEQARQTGAHRDHWEALLTAGIAYRKLKQPERARQRLEESIGITETALARLTAGEGDQASFLASRLGAYFQMVSLLAEQDRAAEAFSYLERAKARVLLDVFRSGKIGINKAMTTDEQAQEKRLRDEMLAFNTQLRRAAQANQKDPADPARVNEAKAGLEKARLAYEAFQTQLYSAHRELRALRGEAPIIKPEELAMLADSKTALLEFAVTEQSVYLFAITRAVHQTQPEIRLYTLPLKQDELTKQAAVFRRQLAEQDLAFRATAKQLYDLLLKPAQAQLAGKTQLIIVPDGKLWELPFQALVTPGNRYLIETAAVSYAPSLTVLREMQAARKRRANVSGELLAFGNPSFGQETVKRIELAYRDEKLTPLPEAEAEVKALGQLYGAGSKVYTNAAAREDRLKAEAANAGVLHIATHGVLNDAAPMYSHLALAASDEKEDGLLEAWELMQLDLKADLAVLSACETARGRIGAGEGVIGLSWALFVAGVPSTVVSQWKVESSSTRDFMLGFHRGLRNKARPLTKAEALRQAVLPLLKNPRTDHPFYWAGFVLVGDGR